MSLPNQDPFESRSGQGRREIMLLAPATMSWRSSLTLPWVKRLTKVVIVWAPTKARIKPPIQSMIACAPLSHMLISNASWIRRSCTDFPDIGG